MWSPSKQLTKPHEGIWDGEMIEFTRSIISTKKSIRVLVIDIKVTRDKAGGAGGADGLFQRAEACSEPS